MNPSVSSVHSVEESTPDDTSGISRLSSLNLTPPCSLMISMVRNVHLFPKRAMTFLTEHISMMDYR